MGEEARMMDNTVTRGEVGPLHGVPWYLRDVQAALKGRVLLSECGGAVADNLCTAVCGLLSGGEKSPYRAYAAVRALRNGCAQLAGALRAAASDRVDHSDTADSGRAGCLVEKERVKLLRGKLKEARERCERKREYEEVAEQIAIYGDGLREEVQGLEEEIEMLGKREVEAEKCLKRCRNDLLLAGCALKRFKSNALQVVRGAAATTQVDTHVASM